MSDPEQVAYVTRAIEARLGLLLADPRVQEALALKTWLEMRRNNPGVDVAAPRLLREMGNGVAPQAPPTVLPRRSGGHYHPPSPGTTSRAVLDAATAECASTRRPAQTSAIYDRVVREAPHAHVKRTTVASMLGKLVDRGYLRRHKHGEYVTTDSFSSTPTQETET